ncbi:MAG: DUF1289 domain-containing protein [Alphaproteobacteria bacterium]|nr:DUF1289 domain-containing protein [Alphaproteobacteria bacterium]
MDPDRRLCRGCGRTIEEIAGWPRASAAEKRAIVARLAGRPSVSIGPESDRSR